jgi:cell division protein FtsL
LEQSTLASPHRVISIAQEDLAMSAPALSAERVLHGLGGALR